MKSKKGFTLVEIIVVVAILVVVAGIFSVNMISTLDKNKDDEQKNVVTQVTSAADAYVAANPEEVSKLYNGHGYVDIKVGELRDAGLLSEEIKYADTGEKISDDEIVRVKLEMGDYVKFIFPVSEEEKNAKAWALMAEDLHIGYNGSVTTDQWCGSRQNIFSGLHDSAYSNVGSYEDVTSKLYLYDNSNDGKMYTGNYFTDAKLSVSSCNVNPKVAGSYIITYTFNDPSLGTAKTMNRNVYVQTSGNDVISFTASINEGKAIIMGAENVPITIVETYKDGKSSSFNTTVEKLGDIKYSIEDFSTSKPGTFTATVSSAKTNSDGSTPTAQKVPYTVTDSFAEILKSTGECTKSATADGCYFRGEQDGNYVKYYDKLFRVYYVNGESIKIIYDGDYINAPYGQLGECISSCCNQGRYAYLSIGDVPTSFSSVMDTHLNNFYTSLNGGGSLSYLQSQTFTTYYNIQDYSERTNNGYYNGLNTVDNLVTTGIKTKSMTTKVALLQLFEYKEIAVCTSETMCTKAKNYLNGSDFWLLDFYGARFGVGAHNKGVMPAEVYDYAVRSAGSIYYAGAVKPENSQAVTTASLGVRPTIKLNNAKITGGTGTKTNPYVIQR